MSLPTTIKLIKKDYRGRPLQSHFCQNLRGPVIGALVVLCAVCACSGQLKVFFSSPMATSVDPVTPRSLGRSSTDAPPTVTLDSRYGFISDPAKKAFFESTPSTATPPAPDRQQPAALADRADVDINVEANINRCVTLCSLVSLHSGTV